MRVPRTPSVSFFPAKQEILAYRFSTLRSDFWAALAVAFMTIPQSIAYSLLAGLPPTAGLFSAIFGAIFTSFFGSSRHLVPGPSTGVAILIQTSISDVLYNYFETVAGPAKDALVLHILGQMVLIIGLIQIGAAFFNVSKLLQFVSRPVMLGYFAGIMIAIIANQLYYFLGIPAAAGDDSSVVLKASYLLTHLAAFDWKTALVGFLAFGSLFFLRSRWKAIPDALIVLILSSLAIFLLNWWLGEPITPTLAAFHLADEPIPEMTWPLIDFRILNKVFPAATAISFLAILEVFSISRNFAARSGHPVQVNQDVFGLGTGNLILSSLVGAMPASGSATRTSLNYRMKAQTRFAAILSGALTAIILIFCWPFVQHVPLAALAALLIAAAPTLINFKEIRLALAATREDRWVFLATFLSCLIFSLDIAFFIGIVLSIGTYLRRSAIPLLVEYAFNSKGRLMVVNPKDDVHRKVRIIGIGGDLYFASADVFQTALQSVVQDPNVQAIILRLNNVHHMDASMCMAIQSLHETLAATNRHLFISGLTEEVWQVFHKTGFVKEIGLDHLYFSDESNPQFSTWKACLRAQELIHKTY